MSNHVQVSVADPFGKLLAEIQPEVSEVSWLLNEVGGVNMTMRTDDDKWRADYFRMGGMVLLEFENGLPDWTGLSTGTQRIRWQNGQRATVAYQSSERYLVRRRSGKNVSFVNRTVSDIVGTLVAEMNGKRKTPIRVGDLWTNSPEVRREYHYTNLFDALKTLQQDTGGDWGVTGGRGTGNRLDLLLNFWPRRGTDKPNVALIEDHNAVVVDYTEKDFNFVNDMVVVGAGSDWGLTRPEGVADDTTSIATYDLWEGATVENDVTSEATLTTIARARVTASLVPYRVLTLDVMDLAPGAFASYHIGDRVSVSCYSVGWGGVEGLGRVTARTFAPATGRSRVVLEL